MTLINTKTYCHPGRAGDCLFPERKWPTLRVISIRILLIGIIFLYGGLPHAQAATITQQNAQENAAAMNILKSFWKKILKLPGINTGPANRHVRMIVIFDANCPMCAHQWAILKPYLSIVRIHWVPIAFIWPSSARLGGALLTAPHPSRALAYNENHYNFQTQTGGYLAPLHVPHKATQEVVNNTRQLLGKQIIGTPSIALQLVPGKTYFFIAGVIPSRRLAHIIPLLSH